MRISLARIHDGTTHGETRESAIEQDVQRDELPVRQDKSRETETHSRHRYAETARAREHATLIGDSAEAFRVDKYKL